MAYYEIDFDRVEDLIRVSRDMKQQLFIDKSVSTMTDRLWFASISEHGTAILNTCTASGEKIASAIAKTKALGPEEAVPEPIEASFSEVK